MSGEIKALPDKMSEGKYFEIHVASYDTSVRQTDIQSQTSFKFHQTKCAVYKKLISMG